MTPGNEVCTRVYEAFEDYKTTAASEAAHDIMAMVSRLETLKDSDERWVAVSRLMARWDDLLEAVELDGEE